MAGVKFTKKAMNNGSDRLTIPEMAEAIKSSGYLLEQRVSAVLAARGYYVETNPAYLDPETGKSREFDISAIAGLQLAKKRMDFIFPVVLAECENNGLPVVFFCAEPQVSFLHHREVKCSGIPVQMWDGQEFTRLSEFLHFENFHHYCEGPTATQYCSFSRKSPSAPWMAMHSDAHHQTFVSLINALESAIDKHYEIWTPPVRGDDESVNIQVYYPVIVLQGKLYRVQERGRRLAIRRCEHVQYRRQYWSAKRKGTYQVDVVTERYFPQYLELLDGEIQTIKRRMLRHQAVARDSIAQLVAKARRVRRKPASLRGIFDFQSRGL